MRDLFFGGIEAAFITFLLMTIIEKLT